MNFVKNKRKKLRHAFSLIELSIVILVIGIIVSGVMASTALIKKFRVTTAQTLTISSPVNGIADSVLWLESSLDKSFKSSESDDSSSLSAWYDIRENVNKNNATQTSSAKYPTYSNSINYVQAVKFDGTNSYFTVDGSVLNNTNYTIFVLEQRDSNKSGNYFIGDASSANNSNTNQNLVLGYSADGTITHAQSSDNSYTSNVSTYEGSSGKARIFTFVHDQSVGKKTYVNGLLAATSVDKNNLTNMNTLAIGKSYQGQIGEVIIFARALNDEERQSIENYLGKKWNSTILRSVGSSASSGGIGGSCVGGTVGTDACLTSCNVTAAKGITATTVNGGSGSLACDTTNNFTGSLAYSCINGAFQYTAATYCSCATGYTASGSSCTPINPSCSGGTVDTSSVSGYKIHVFISSGNLSCTAGGTIQLLVVAGGGGGGWGGGGGGAGGLVYNSSYSISATSYTVTVGAGGTGGTGNDSVFNDITAKAGGGQCGVGGSGGGGGYGSGCSGSGTSGQGNKGGSCDAVSGSCGNAGAGGGGAGGQGSNPVAVNFGGNGGAGIYYGSVFSNSYGDSGWFASGGGGSGTTGSGGTAGTASSGGGGNGGSYSISGTGSLHSGKANTGGGGGGGNGNSTNGGSGVVIVRYAQ